MSLLLTIIYVCVYFGHDMYLSYCVRCCMKKKLLKNICEKPLGNRKDHLKCTETDKKKTTIVIQPKIMAALIKAVVTKG